MAPTAEQKGSQREVMAIAPWWCLHLWRGSLSLHRPGKPQSLISIIQSIWACISNGESPNQWVIGLLSLLPVLGRSPYFSTLHTFSTHTHPFKGPTGTSVEHFTRSGFSIVPTRTFWLPCSFELLWGEDIFSRCLKGLETMNLRNGCYTS